MCFNDKQKEAIKHNEGPMMVIAGPGSGKTMVITYRVNSLVKEYNVNPNNILVVTFTKAAAMEMKNRYIDISNSNNCLVNFGTCHSVFFNILRKYTEFGVNNIISEDQKNRILKELIKINNINYEDEKEIIELIKSDISTMKNELIKIEHYNSMHLSKSDFEDIIKGYELYKKKYKKLDFDDMLVWTYMLLVKNPSILKEYQEKYKYILVDEFQDINKVQFEIIKLLSAPNDNIFIVGDDDQSIYKFRGAKPEIFLEFPKIYKDTKKIILDINYRSNNVIVKAANNLIKNNKKRFDKQLKSVKEENIKINVLNFETGKDEAKTIIERIKIMKQENQDKDIAIIYRTNMQARTFVEKLVDNNIDFVLKDEIPDIYSHWIIEDIMSYIKASIDEGSQKDIVKVINKPNRYISKKNTTEALAYGGNILRNLQVVKGIKSYQIDRICELQFKLSMLNGMKFYEAVDYVLNNVNYDSYIDEYSEKMNIDKKSLWEIIDEFRDLIRDIDTYREYIEHVMKIRKKVNKRNVRKRQGNVILTTMHSSKGLEFDTVFIVGVSEGIIPYQKSDDEKNIDIEEERRLMYVALTRAKNALVITNYKKRYNKELKRSRFINEIAG